MGHWGWNEGAQGAGDPGAVGGGGNQCTSTQGPRTLRGDTERVFLYEAGDVAAAGDSIIGCAGEEVSRVSIGGRETVMVSWTGNGGFMSNMNATFDNDHLVAKAQLGLE
jgi:hypothetical protein